MWRPPSMLQSATASISLAVLLILIPHAAAASSVCNSTIDPVGSWRPGGDFLSFPLPSTGTLSDCIALCCATSTCLSISFQSPQPNDTSIGGVSCVAGGVCCFLKGDVPALQPNNPYPVGSVRSAVLSLPPGPGPAPPLAASSAIAGASFGSPSYWAAGHGDTWPTAWTADNRLFGWACDTEVNGTNTPMAFYEFTGNPYGANASASFAPVLVAADPLNWTALCAPYHPAPNLVNIKSGGIVEVEGVLYTGVMCITYGQDSTLFIRQHDLAGFIAASTDRGATWANVTAVNSFPGRFAAPMFASCGPGLPCVDADGFTWTYAFFTGSAFNDFAYWENGDAHYLARVPPALIANPAAYQYFVGYSGGAPARPQWSPDATQAQPILAFGRMLGQNAVHYNAQIGRWLIANYGFIDDAGSPWPWHQLSWTQHNNPRRTQLLMLEAPEPWGPWSVFFRDDNAGAAWGAQGLYGTTFPALYHKPVVNGTAEMIMFFACGLGNPGCYYTLNWVTVTLTLAAP